MEKVITLIARLAALLLCALGLVLIIVNRQNVIYISFVLAFTCVFMVTEILLSRFTARRKL